MVGTVFCTFATKLVVYFPQTNIDRAKNNCHFVVLDRIYHDVRFFGHRSARINGGGGEIKAN